MYVCVYIKSYYYIIWTHSHYTVCFFYDIYTYSDAIAVVFDGGKLFQGLIIAQWLRSLALHPIEQT